MSTGNPQDMGRIDGFIDFYSATDVKVLIRAIGARTGDMQQEIRQKQKLELLLFTWFTLRTLSLIPVALRRDVSRDLLTVAQGGLGGVANGYLSSISEASLQSRGGKKGFMPIVSFYGQRGFDVRNKTYGWFLGKNTFQYRVRAIFALAYHLVFVKNKNDARFHALLRMTSGLIAQIALTQTISRDIEQGAGMTVVKMYDEN